MIPISVIDTSAPFANQLAGVQKLGAQADRDHLRGLARCYAASYGFGWYHYQHDPAALTIELTKRQVPIAEQGANQWLPIARVCFGDFDPKGTKVSYMGVSGLTKWNWDTSKQRGAGVMRHLFEEDIHPDEAEEYIFNFKGGVTGIIKADTEKNGQKRSPRKPVTKQRKTELTQRAKALPKLPEALIDTLPVADAAGHFAQAWVYIENGQVFLGGIVPNSENEALKAADTHMTALDEAPVSHTLEGVFEHTPEMARASAKMQRNFLASTSSKRRGDA